jgi:hypothetical protein
MPLKVFVLFMAIGLVITASRGKSPGSAVTRRAVAARPLFL